MRMAMDMEVIYARDYPFVDYGIDLKLMADMEKGMRISNLNPLPTDTDKANKPMRIPENIKEDTERYLEAQRPRKYDLIPMKFWGKGGHGYTLYDWVHHRGKGAPKLSKKHSDLIRYYGSENERIMSKELNKRFKLGGPRFAMMASSKRRKAMNK